MTQIALSLGSNINPRHHLRSAIKELHKILNDITISSTYITAPWGMLEQHNFLNLALTAHSNFSPIELLKQCQHIEKKHHRQRSIENGPRTLDIDILLYGDSINDADELILPHPALCDRDFMLIPLLEIAPNIIHPTYQQPLAKYKETIKYQQILSTEPHHLLNQTPEEIA